MTLCGNITNHLKCKIIYFMTFIIWHPCDQDHNCHMYSKISTNFENYIPEIICIKNIYISKFEYIQKFQTHYFFFSFQIQLFFYVQSKNSHSFENIQFIQDSRIPSKFPNLLKESQICSEFQIYSDLLNSFKICTFIQKFKVIKSFNCNESNQFLSTFWISSNSVDCIQQF